MMEWFAPLLLALLFIVFGIMSRGRTHRGCAACTGEGDCEGNAGRDCSKTRETTSNRSEVD